MVWLFMNKMDSTFWAKVYLKKKAKDGHHLLSESPSAKKKAKDGLYLLGESPSEKESTKLQNIFTTSQLNYKPCLRF